MSRSIAQQLEHWAMLGRALEHQNPGLARDQIIEALLRDRKAEDLRLVDSGVMQASDLSLFSKFDMQRDVKLNVLQGIA